MVKLVENKSTGYAVRVRVATPPGSGRGGGVMPRVPPGVTKVRTPPGFSTAELTVSDRVDIAIEKWSNRSIER